jgi:hypothetical protein
MIRTLIGLALLALAGCASAPFAAALTDDEIRYRMIREVTVAYGGACACPAGQAEVPGPCNKQNASATSGGKYRFCAPEDISQREVDAYRLGLAAAPAPNDSESDPFSP